MKATYDFSGYATKNDLKCADGRVIKRDAFARNDGEEVSLVWNHQHDGPSNVIGHALLENRADGVYAYCTLNDTENGRTAKELIKHGDIRALSIYANQLRQNGADVVHGIIREVSLVIAGANPGAFIDSIIAHSDDSDEDAIMYFDQEIIMHSDEEPEEDDEEVEEVEDTEEDETEEVEEELEHSDTDKEETVGDVFNTLTDKQKNVVYAIIGDIMEHSKKETKENNESEGGEKAMKHNLFDPEDNQQNVLSHSAVAAIVKDAKRLGSLKESFLEHSAEYGIENIDYLMPEYKNVNGNEPGFIKRNPDEWVNVVMNGVHHTPFGRIKMVFADITEDEARAKGYTKGKLKKEEVFSLLKRTVGPTTIYKKQKMDRDDVIDITDLDVIAWLKSEMRMMLDEEIARAILFGDGRTALSDDKIDENCIIPIVKDAALYTIQQTVAPASGETLAHAIINAAVKGQDTYEGSGNTILFTKNTYVTDMLLMEDVNGRRMYKDVRDIALAMSVNRLVKVPASIVPDGIYGVIVDLKDYNVGADKGGAVNMFDDFDIDYNQMKYLIETHCSGALTKPYSAVVLKASDDSVA